MINVGIDTLAFYSSHYALELKTLATARGIDVDKYQVGLGQHIMAVAAPGEDIVTMAANAAEEALQGIDKSSIELVLFATESGIDHSKAAGIFVHELLDLPARCRVVELKQACYSGTAALQLAMPFLRENPDKKVLMIASDIARYGLETTGESSQGCGAIAMVLSANPRLMVIEKEYGVVTDNVMDFWRPNYLQEALVEGKYSSKLYLAMMDEAWQQYSQLSHRQYGDHAYFCYHTPVPRLVEKAHQFLGKVNGVAASIDDVSASLVYGRQIGNSYAASLYISLASLLDNLTTDLTNKRIGFYSYGSGCVAEFFSGVIQANYKKAIHQSAHTQLLAARQFLTYDQYVAFYNFKYPEDGSDMEVPYYETGRFRLARIQHHKRVYECVGAAAISAVA